MNRESRADSRGDMRETDLRHENGHWRNNSGTSAGDYLEQQAASSVRRHDYDAHSMASDLSPRASVTNAIPPPTVTVKSEFPTITRSKDQQSLTCLVTLEVVEKKWQNYQDTPGAPPIPSLPPSYDPQYAPPSPTGRSQYSFEQDAVSTKQKERDLEREREREREQEALAAITEELRLRVENWHGLDFNR
jgi:hypothetical protein